MKMTEKEKNHRQVAVEAFTAIMLQLAIKYNISVTDAIKATGNFHDLLIEYEKDIEQYEQIHKLQIEGSTKEFIKINIKPLETMGKGVESIYGKKSVEKN